MMQLFWALLLVITLILQVSILPLIAYAGNKPDLLLMITLSAGLLYGREHGVGIGFFAGLLQDLAAGGIFGLNTLSKVLVGYVAGMAERKVFKEHILLPLFSVGAATAAQYIFHLLLLFLFAYKVNFVDAIMRNLIPMVIYNMLFSVPMHGIVYKLGQLER